MSDTNLKTYVNYQMYISVVQENHNVNIKIVFNLAKNFVYFWTVFTKHPVVESLTANQCGGWILCRG